MAKKITEIYTEYKISPNLQRHMLWVAAVATMICDNFDESLPKEDIVTACLLHDMGNIVKYDMDVFPDFLEPEGAEYWKKIQAEFIEKYGKDDHHANLKIVKEFNVSAKVIDCVNKISFSLTCANRDSNDIVTKIIEYSDHRVNPFGIVSYDERMEEARKRYQNRENNDFKEEERQKLVACGKDSEKQIFTKCKIKPEDINDETVKPIIEKLKDFMIK
jgi:HD superfamily phosphodiesterase